MKREIHWEKKMLRKVYIAIILALFHFSSSYAAENEAYDIVEAGRAKGGSVRSITPIFSQLMLLNIPKGFFQVFEKAQPSFYIQESVPKGETVNNWTQMVTVTGAKGIASNPNATPEKYVLGMANGFNRGCPKSFSATNFGEQKIDGYDAFVAVISCGQSPVVGNQKSELALIIAIKGEQDYYTIQWAERTLPSSSPLAIDKEVWTERLNQLLPVKLCTKVPGERPPYPSCISGK